MESNSESMKNLVVETFYVEEIAPLIYDEEQLDEWKKLNAKLGLQGQESLHSEPESDPIPFMHLKEKHARTLITLCPREVDYKKFNITPIPLEILKAIDHAVSQKMFYKITVRWDDKSPDPAVIGHTKLWGEWSDYSYRTKEEAEFALGKKLGEYNYQETRYLIGKWGDVALDWDYLVSKAIYRHTKEQRTMYEEYIKDYQRKLDDVIVESEKYFA